MSYKYKIFGLTFESEKEISNIPTSIEPTDVTIEFKKLPDTLGPDATKKPFYEALKSKVLLKHARFGKIYQENGDKIIVDIHEGLSTEEIRPYLFGTIIGSIAHQRGLLPLHASAINYNGQAILFSGKSGAGKSSVVAEFNKRGFEIISDDTILANKKEDGSFYTYSGAPEIKLWQDIGNNYTHLGDDKIQILNVEKYRYNLPMNGNDKCYNIKRLYKIKPNSDKDIETSDAKTFQKINIIKSVTYRLKLGHFTGNKKTHFKMAADFANAVEIKTVTRPRIYNDPKLIVDVLLKDLEKGFTHE